jgi:PEP-CTERM motif
MKNAFLAVIICAMTTISPLFGAQSLSFTGPSTIDITTTNTFTLSVNLTFSGYNAVGLSYWLEVQNALASFLTITNVTHYPPFPGGPDPVPISFTTGGDPGYSTTSAGFDGINMSGVTPGTYHIADMTFMLAPGTPLGMSDLRSTTASPRTSEVTDTDFNDNNLPAAHFTINIVPEPSTLSFLGLAAVGSGFMAYRRRRVG